VGRNRAGAGLAVPVRAAGLARVVIDDDREAVRRVQQGDSEAFEYLVDKYKRRAFRLAYQVLRDQEESLDVAQEAFVKAYRALPGFKGDSQFFTWLFRITMNLALDRKRQRAARARSLGGEDVPPEEWERTAVSTDPAPDDEAAGAERRARIARALDSLSEHHRSIIILSDVEGLAYREIADVLHIPMGTVMSRLHHARRRLREALGPGFAAVLLALGALLGAAGPARAQAPAPPPYAPAAPPSAGAPGQQVCVYALVLLASNGPAGASAGVRGAPPGPRAFAPAPVERTPPPQPYLAPTPELRPADPGPEAGTGGGCGTEVRLRLWVPRLQEVFGYAFYEPISAFEAIMPVGMSQRFALPGGRELELQPVAVRPPVVRILVRIRRGPVPEMTTVMDVPPRRPALVGGAPHGSGVLIIAIRSRID
jgi:RNA polymerase sigma-70 factor (ECF subfamily)